MALSDLLNRLGLDFSSETALNIGTYISGTVVFLGIAIIVAGLTFYIVSRRAYNKHIHMFEEINGQTTPIGMDKAREVVLPFTSVRAFYLRKRKIYLPRPSKQTGKNHYWFFIRDDGEWMNIIPSNINKQLKELDMKYDHTDMRMANASLKKLVEKNYKRTNWLKEYAPYIGFALLILMLGIVGFLIFGEAGKTLSGLSSNTENLAKVTEEVARLLGGAESITTGSGIVEAG